MLSDAEKSKLRSLIFRHLDGMPVAATINSLARKGILELFVQRKDLLLSDIQQQTNANEGYLNIALRLLCSQGWLKRDRIGLDLKYTITPEGEEVFQAKGVYECICELRSIAVSFWNKFENGFTVADVETLEDMVTLKAQNWKLDFYDLSDNARYQVQCHLDGNVVGPLLVSLGMSGLAAEMVQSGKIVDRLVEHQIGDILKAMIIRLGWLDSAGNLNDVGIFMLKRASAYGVTTSYFQTFAWIPELLFGKADKLWDKAPGAPEIHVDRTMNVWGSGGAHSTYFKVVDEVVREIFNRPIEEQPRGIADMGCGNGAFLQHLYELVVTETERGKVIDEYPLLIIGSDFNEAALVSTKITLDNAGIEHVALHGDIGNPDALSAELKEKYDIKLGELLNVRSFLDHNRVFSPCEQSFESRKGTTTGAFAFRGRRVNAEEIEQNLCEHFKKWSNYVERFGLLVIELHTIPPSVAAANPGRIAITAYDGTHGYTDQYIVEHDVFVRMALEAGLVPDKNHQTMYPNPDMAVVSINLFSSGK